MRQHVIAAAIFGSVLVTGSVFAAAPIENVPLAWKPTSVLSEMGTIDLSGPILTTKIRFEPLVDTRQNPALVAENREKADKVRPMTTSSDVAAFVTEHLKDSVHGAGLSVVDADADLSVSGEIRKFFVTEDSTYNGEMSLLIHVKDKSGKELWTGIVNGDATRWGRSYKAENYFEVMSDMILR
ncbi:MAG: hypothetical protein WBF21_19325, partial [Steroidobacteraceae bacterium]